MATNYHTYVSIACDRCGETIIQKAATEASGERAARAVGAEQRGLEVVCEPCCKIERGLFLAGWQLEEAVEGRR